jgi:LemA protein
VKKVLILVPVLIVAGFAAGTKLISVRHDLEGQREAASQAWAQVELALQSRADRLPELVAIMKGAGVQTADFQEVAKARAALASGRSPQEKIRANDQLSAVLGRLLVLSENYAQLRKNREFQRIQDDIAEKENDIALERRKYNEILEHYNAQIQTFPDNLVAGVSGFTRNDRYFPTEPGVHGAPKASGR